MQDAKEEVRSKLNIEDVIGEYVQLKRAGRNFKGLSPFTSEKTPSFVVSPDKQIWHDFSSNRGGDVFTFIMEVEGLDFMASLELLARKAGVDLSQYKNNGDQELARRKKRLYEAHELATLFYQKSLVNNQHAIDYVFKKRGLNKQIVQDFKIGYAPDSGDALVQFLKKKGWTANELVVAGLTNRFGGDLFRGRMMVPLMDVSGRVIGFTGRIIKDDINAPKYLNTPQTPIYDKGHHVFGLSQAKEAIRGNDYVVVVEGNMDVISSHQAGIKQVVATAGTAMTEWHLKALVRLTNNIRLSFDGDKAGLAAAERAIPIAQNVGVDMTIISMPNEAKDPDELIKIDPNLWQQAIDASEPVFDWVLRQYAKREDLTTTPGKVKFTNAAIDMVRLLHNPVEQYEYIAKIEKYSTSSKEALIERLKDVDTAQPKTYKPVVARGAAQQDPDEYQDNLIALALVDGATHELFRTIDPDMFVGEQRQAVVEYLANSNGKSIKEVPKTLQKYDMYVKILLLRADARYADWNDNDRYYEAARLLRQVVNEHKKKQKDKLTEQLREVEALGDDAKANDIRMKLNQLIKEIQNGRR